MAGGRAASPVAALREVRRNRDLTLLLVVFGVWITADWALLITVSLLALELDGPAAVGIVGAVRVLPAALLTGPASLLADRWSRHRLLGAVNLGWALLALLLAWSAGVGASLGVLLVLVGAGAALGAVVKPTLQAVMPTLVGTPSQLIGANSAYATIEGLGTVLGPGLCAAALSLIEPQGVFVVVAVLFVGAAVASLRMRTPHQPAVVARSGRHDLLAPLRGFGVLFGHDVRLTSSLILAQTTMRGFLNVFVVLVAASLTADTESLTSAAFVAMGIGGLVGASVGAALAGSRRGSLWMGVGIVGWGLPVLLVGLFAGPATLVGLLAVIGLGNAVLDVFGYSLLNRMFPDHLAGRAWGAFHAAGAGAVALGSLLAPPLAALLGLPGAMVLTGGLLAAAPLVAWPWFRRVDARAAGDQEALALLRTVTVLAPMSTIALERLARVAGQVRLAAGEAAVREGELSDCFFVVAEGTLSVSQGGRAIRDLGPGDAFGEIGLLEPGPRTATVVAVGEVRLLRLDGPGFVAAVTGHRPSDEAVRGAVSAYRREDERRRDVG